MALRDQPYFPLYVQDFMTDEKIRECEADTIGVYIFIMCLMHKSQEYGTILLKQKDKQNDEQIVNFAAKLDKHLPFAYGNILQSLKELLDMKILYIDGDKLYQKRMVHDGVVSLSRSKSGKKGGDKSKLIAKFARAKDEAKTEENTEIEIEYESEVNNDNNEDKPLLLKKPTIDEFLEYAKTIMSLEIFYKHEIDLRNKFKAWDENNWHTLDKKQRKIKNWKSTLVNSLKYITANDVKTTPAAYQTASQRLKDLVKPIKE